jgi:hypothetical protein
LPRLDRQERWRDVGVTRPKGVVRREFQRASTKARTTILFTGSTPAGRAP